MAVTRRAHLHRTSHLVQCNRAHESNPTPSAERTPGEAMISTKYYTDAGLGSIIVILTLLATAPGCFDSSLGPAVLDIEYVDMRVDNQLLAPIIIFRNGEAIDTLAALGDGVYPIGKRGMFSHGWRLIRPVGPSGAIIGTARSGEFGIQNSPSESYAASAYSGTSQDAFAPLVDNRSRYPIQVHIGSGTVAPSQPEFIVPGDTILGRENLPYFTWSETASVWLINPLHRDTLRFSAADTGATRLQIESAYSGVTKPLIYRLQ